MVLVAEGVLPCSLKNVDHSLDGWLWDVQALLANFFQMKRFSGGCLSLWNGWKVVHSFLFFINFSMQDICTIVSHSAAWAAAPDLPTL